MGKPDDMLIMLAANQHAIRFREKKTCAINVPYASRRYAPIRAFLLFCRDASVRACFVQVIELESCRRDCPDFDP